MTIHASGCTPALIDAAKQPVYFSQAELRSMFAAEDIAYIQKVMEEAAPAPKQTLSINTEGAGENFVDYLEKGMVMSIIGGPLILTAIGLVTTLFNTKKHALDMVLITLAGVILVPLGIATVGTSIEMIERTEVSPNQLTLRGQPLAEIQTLSSIWDEVSSDHTSHQAVESVTELLSSMHTFFAEALPTKGISGYCHPAAAGAPASCTLSRQDGQTSTETL